MALFNIDGLTVSGNVVDHTNAAFMGRRGFNLNGVQNVLFQDNAVSLGITDLSEANTVFNRPRYNIPELSMSDRATSNVDIVNNMFDGAYDGIITLGNGEIDEIGIASNTFTNFWIGIRTQAGMNGPVGSVDSLRIIGNQLSDMGYGIYLGGGDTDFDPYTNVSAYFNDLSNNSVSGLFRVSALAFAGGLVDATDNWWEMSAVLFMPAIPAGRALLYRTMWTFAPWLGQCACGEQCQRW